MNIFKPLLIAFQTKCSFVVIGTFACRGQQGSVHHSAECGHIKYNIAIARIVSNHFPED